MGRERLLKLEHMLVAEPDDEFLQYAMGLEYRGLGEHDRAAQVFEQLLKAHPRSVPTLHMLAHTYLDLGRTADAVRSAEKGASVAQDIGDHQALRELQELINAIAGLDP